MNFKGRKKYIIAGSMLAAGLLIFTIGFAVTGFNLKQLSTVSPYEEKEYTESEKVTDIQVDINNQAIELISTKEDQLHIRYFENEEISYSIENEGGRLHIKTKDDSKWYDHFFVFDLHLTDTKMVISIPENFVGDIDVKTSNASVDFSGIKTKKLIVDNSNGRIKIDDLSIAEDLDVKTSNSPISLENVQISGDARIKTGNGAVILKNTDISGKSICNTSNSSISLSSVSGDDFELRTNNGKINLAHISSYKGVLAETSNSSILLDDVDVGESIICTNSNGSIKGTIVGAMEDFSITSHTSNGNNNLPTGTDKGRKTARFKTSNSSIQIDFTE